MADYARSTRRTTLGTLPGVLRAAVLERIAATQLTVPAEAPAFLTHNTRLRGSGLLRRMTGSGDPDQEHDEVAVVLGPRDVIVAVHGERRGTSVLAARLEDADVADLAAQFGDLAAKVDDHGVTIAGFPMSVDGVTGRGSFFVGLGAPDGDAASAAVREAVRVAKAA